MIISRLRRSLSKPTGRDKIPTPTLAYFRMRTRMLLFDLVRTELAKAGISKAVLAERLNKGADQINHWLAGPRNWTIDTISDLLFAMAGGVLAPAVSYPLDTHVREDNSEKPTAPPSNIIQLKPIRSTEKPAPAKPDLKLVGIYAA